MLVVSDKAIVKVDETQWRDLKQTSASRSALQRAVHATGSRPGRSPGAGVGVVWSTLGRAGTRGQGAGEAGASVALAAQAGAGTAAGGRTTLALGKD